MMSSHSATSAAPPERKNRRFWALIPAGPAITASIAYMDPGNFATNIQAGAAHNYTLLWVVLTASLIAMVFQALAARIGIVTRHNLAELCRMHLSPVLVIPMWIVSEIAAMATDLAEFLGGAIGLALLCHIPLLWGMAITAVITYALLVLQRFGIHPIERVIALLAMTIGFCYVVELFIAPPMWGDALYHSFVPSLPDADSFVLAVGIVGATVMPHAIYLHSSLTQDRHVIREESDYGRAIRHSNRETIIALSCAGLVNMAMLAMAASAFHQGHSDIAEIETAYHTLTPLLGPAAAGFFLVALLSSGISSSVVGTMAGQIIMQGFIRRYIPIWVRRLVTMLPAFVIVMLGYNTTVCLVISQVVLSMALPIPMIALLFFVRRRDIMRGYRVGTPLYLFTIAGTGVVLLLNVLLLAQVCGLGVAGLPSS